MPETRAQRTLVKSPPELWAEISDAPTLARRLSALDEVRITRMEPETAVAWEGARIRGTVGLAASGWGTSVTITAERVLEEPPPPAETSAEVEATGTDIPPHDAGPEPRAGFLARLRSWWHTGRWATTPPAPAPPAEQPTLPGPIAPPEVEPMVSAEAPSDDEIEGLLVAVLDDLGSAHHRPFSRA